MRKICIILVLILTFLNVPISHANSCYRNYLLPSSDQTKRIGTHNVQILFVKFADSPRKNKNFTKNWLKYLDLKEMSKYIQETSYNKTKLKFNVNYNWITLPNNSYDYGLQFSMTESQENSFRDAIIGAAAIESKIDSVYVIPDPELSQYYIAFRNPAFINGKKTMVVMYNETNAFLGVSEILHSFGLRDLYSSVGIYGPSGGMEQFSIMSQYYGGTSILGYEKFALGWLGEKDFTCFEGGTQTFKLNSLDSKGLKLILIPINSMEMIGIEYRKKEKRDKYLGGSGVLVYHINDALINNPEHISPINTLFFGKKGNVDFQGVKIKIAKESISVTK